MEGCTCLCVCVAWCVCMYECMLKYVFEWLCVCVCFNWQNETNESIKICSSLSPFQKSKRMFK